MTASITTLPARTRPAPELERLVMGGALNLAQAHAGFVDALGLIADDFLDPMLRQAWFCILGMTKARRELTAQTVFATGARLKVLDDSASSVLQALAAESAMTKAEAMQVARDLRRVGHLRRTRVALVQQVQYLDQADAQPQQVANALEAMAGRLAADFEPDSDASGDVFDLHEGWNVHREKGTSARLSSGIPLLDQAIGGGFPEQGVTLFVADSGVGKTTVLASMIRAMLQGNPTLKVGVFGLEDGVAWLPRRWAAADLGIPLATVGWAKLDDELEARRAGLSEAHAALASRVMAYRRDDINARQLVHRATGWVQQHGVGGIFVDVLTDLRADGWEAVANDMRDLRNFAFRYRTPVIAAVHLVADKNAAKHAAPGPPAMGNVAGGRALDRRARLMVGLWNKGDALRATILKNNEGGPKGVTIEFDRLIEAGMVRTEGGTVVDLKAEAAQERRAAQEAKDATALALLDKKRQRREAEKEAKAKKAEPAPPAQASLLPEGA